MGSCMIRFVAVSNYCVAGLPNMPRARRTRGLLKITVQGGVCIFVREYTPMVDYSGDC